MVSLLYWGGLDWFYCKNIFSFVENLGDVTSGNGITLGINISRRHIILTTILKNQYSHN